ncbi:hypothetical protein [Gluconobacter morbifer]|uniref:Phage protein n=1 Tax=Gluconobacter morbifer G707 TaxID=1088869 RepID=G6XKX1_9PROT|nr:hypothetical protein [Gluconobacter morbifer]EHH67566.1 hypothetical protein GMO_21370 [Gluconobacter morbifer G707]
MRPLSENQYPDLLISGGPLADLFGAIEKRLKELFDPKIYTHSIIPPRATARDWENITKRMPMVTLGWMACKPSSRIGDCFRGDAQFALILLTRQNAGRDAYYGDGKLPGVMGLGAIAAFGLHGFNVRGIGSCRIEIMAASGDQDWIPDGVASVQLQITVPEVSFDSPELMSQLDTLTSLSSTFKDSSSGETS